jgi:hypothetical protein
MHYCEQKPRANPQQIVEMTSLVFKGYDHEIPHKCPIKTLLAPFLLLLSRIREARDPPPGSLCHSLLGRLLELGPEYAQWVKSAADAQDRPEELKTILLVAAEDATRSYLQCQRQRDYKLVVGPGTFLAANSLDTGLSKIAMIESSGKPSALYKLFCDAFADVLGTQLLEPLPTKPETWLQSLSQLQWQIFTHKSGTELLLHRCSLFSLTLFHKLLKSLILHMERYKAFSEHVSKVFSLFHLMQSLDVPDQAKKAMADVKELLVKLAEHIISHRSRFLDQKITVREILELGQRPEREFAEVVGCFLKAWAAADEFNGARKSSPMTFESLRALCDQVAHQEPELQRLLRVKRWLDARHVLVVDPSLVPHGLSFDFDPGVASLVLYDHADV